MLILFCMSSLAQGGYICGPSTHNHFSTSNYYSYFYTILFHLLDFLQSALNIDNPSFPAILHPENALYFAFWARYLIIDKHSFRNNMPKCASEIRVTDGILHEMGKEAMRIMH